MRHEIKYYLEDTEYEAAQSFIKLHYLKHQNMKAAIGGMFVWTFCNTSLGTVTKVRCDGCSETIDITNYNSW